MQNPDRVLEARVTRPGKHEIGRAELLHAAQPLEGPRVDERNLTGAERNVAPHRIAQHRRTHRFTVAGLDLSGETRDAQRMDRAAELAKTSLFCELDDEALDALANRVVQRRYRKGNVVFV